jgi:hypothetical protein
MRSEQDSLNRISPVASSLTGTQIQAGITAGGGHTWVPAIGANKLSYCKGASLLTTGTTGLLAVHLVEDPVGVWYLIDLAAGNGIFGAEFDLVGDSTLGTTVALDGKLFIYPGQYANISDLGY